MLYHEYKVDGLKDQGGGRYRYVYRGFSHVTHWDDDSGLESPHKAQFQVPSLTVGTFIPAAAKSKLFTTGAGGAFGFGVSHVSHLPAEVGFDRLHRAHCQVSLLTVGAFIPAAAKSNP